MRALTLSLGYGDMSDSVTIAGATAVYLHEAREARSKGDVVGVVWMLGTPAVGSGKAELALAVGVPGIGDPAPAAVGAADITAAVQTTGGPSLATIVLAQDIAPGDGLFLIAAARGFSTPPRLVASSIVDLPGMGVISTNDTGYMPSENIGTAVTFEAASTVHPFTAIVRW